MGGAGAGGVGGVGPRGAAGPAGPAGLSGLSGFGGGTAGSKNTIFATLVKVSNQMAKAEGAPFASANANCPVPAVGSIKPRQANAKKIADRIRKLQQDGFEASSGKGAQAAKNPLKAQQTKATGKAAESNAPTKSGQPTNTPESAKLRAYESPELSKLMKALVERMRQFNEGFAARLEVLRANRLHAAQPAEQSSAERGNASAAQAGIQGTPPPHRIDPTRWNNDEFQNVAQSRERAGTANAVQTVAQAAAAQQTMAMLSSTAAPGAAQAA